MKKRLMVCMLILATALAGCAKNAGTDAGASSSGATDSSQVSEVDAQAGSEESAEQEKVKVEWSGCEVAAPNGKGKRGDLRGADPGAL